MQTNSGAGFGTADSRRSAASAINTVATVRAGPKMARQSNFKSAPLVSCAHENKSGSLMDCGALSAAFLASTLKRR